MPRIMALDYGTRRIGIAVSDEAGIIAMPLLVLRVRNRLEAIEDIRRICVDKNVAKIIVGMPINMDGSIGEPAQEATGFARRVGECLKMPVETWDERLSTRMAERALLDSDMSRKKRKRVIDKLAAQVVLQSYLDARQSKQQGRRRDRDAAL